MLKINNIGRNFSDVNSGSKTLGPISRSGQGIPSIDVDNLGTYINFQLYLFHICFSPCLYIVLFMFENHDMVAQRSNKDKDVYILVETIAHHNKWKIRILKP